jgi:hypothetical protein
MKHHAEAKKHMKHAMKALENMHKEHGMKKEHHKKEHHKKAAIKEKKHKK